MWLINYDDASFISNVMEMWDFLEVIGSLIRDGLMFSLFHKHDVY